jgi:hypothetical protein
MVLRSFLTVLVLYLVLHQGAGIWSQQVVFFKEDAGIKVKTPDTGKNESRRDPPTLLLQGYFKLHHFPGQSP